MSTAPTSLAPSRMTPSGRWTRSVVPATLTTGVGGDDCCALTPTVAPICATAMVMMAINRKDLTASCTILRLNRRANRISLAFRRIDSKLDANDPDRLERARAGLSRTVLPQAILVDAIEPKAIKSKAVQSIPIIGHAVIGHAVRVSRIREAGCSSGSSEQCTEGDRNSEA